MLICTGNDPAQVAASRVAPFSEVDTGEQPALHLSDFRLYPFYGGLMAFALFPARAEQRKGVFLLIRMA